MTWMSRVIDTIEQTFADDSKVMIAVHDNNQYDMGRTIAQSIANRLGKNFQDIGFKVINPEEQDAYPIGTVIEKVK